MTSVRIPTSSAARCAALALFVSVLASPACTEDPSPAPPQEAAPDAGTVRQEPDMTEPDAAVEDAMAEVTPEMPCNPALSAVSANPVSMMVGQTAVLTMFLGTCDGIEIRDALVGFELLGTGDGSRLLATNGITDRDGLATVTLVAGDSPSAFEVEVTATDTDAFRFSVTVTALPTGDMQVFMTYGGDVGFDWFSVHLIEGITCDALDAFAISEPMSTASLTRLADRADFPMLLPSTEYVVAIQALREDELLGYGCEDEIEIVANQQTTVTVELGELPIVFTGIYQLDNRFDMADALPGSVGDTLRIFDEMTDDDSLAGDLENEEYGQDPAAFLADFIYREACCWTAEPDPFDGEYSYQYCDEEQGFNHAIGDLSKIYTDPTFFLFSDGAQPRESGMCGVFALFDVNQLVQGFIVDVLDDTIPDEGLALLEMAGDLARAFTDMHITSELSVGEAFQDKYGHFTHVLKTMIVEIHDIDGDVHTYEFNLTDAGLENLEYTDEVSVDAGDRLVIPEHSFRLDFGRLLVFIYTDILLPNFDCDPDHDGTTEPCESTADVFQTWVDCEGIGNSIDGDLDILGGVIDTFCTLGLMAAGSLVESQLAQSVDAETTLTLEGSCASGAIDERRQVTELVDGVWDGTVSEGDEVNEVDGTFVGDRISGP